MRRVYRSEAATHSQRIRPEFAPVGAEERAAAPQRKRKPLLLTSRREAEQWQKKYCGANRNTPFCGFSARDRHGAGVPGRREAGISYPPQKRRELSQPECGWRNSSNPNRPPGPSAPRKCKVRCAVTYESGPKKRVQLEI